MLKAPVQRFQCLRVNFRTVQRIQKELDEFNGDYEGTAAQKPHWSFYQETLKFVDEIQAIINNDTNKSVMSIAMDTEVSTFLIKQVVHEDIYYFSNKTRKGQFLWLVIKTKRRDSSIPSNWTWFDFSQIKKFLSGLDDKFTEQVLACLVPKRWTDSDENHSQHPGVLSGY